MEGEMERRLERTGDVGQGFAMQRLRGQFAAESLPSRRVVPGQRQRAVRGFAQRPRRYTVEFDLGSGQLARAQLALEPLYAQAAPVSRGVTRLGMEQPQRAA